ncbi:MAG TPA: HAD family hydrolase [Candidatus Mediterraneibacter avicola]|nr:HAD family hydrolase [Candidatus Mediterraneibacter avicola]
MSIKHILFDLDGTLLPMVQDEFVKFYMPLLAKSYMNAGVSLDPKKFIGAVWAGYEAMVKNDGSCTNREAFWSYIEPELPISTEESEKIALNFYADEFNQAICTTKPNPVSNQIVKRAKERGFETYLATNPVFPRCATMNRIRWAGLDAEDFKVITTYETCTYCKPNPEYFRGILEEFSLDPSECLMVGNDVAEDLSIRSLGVKTYLVTDTMENKKNLPIDAEYMGTLDELLKFIETI